MWWYAEVVTSDNNSPKYQKTANVLNVQDGKQILILQSGDLEFAADLFYLECNAWWNLQTSLSSTGERTKNKNMELTVAFSSDLTMLTVSNKRHKTQWQHTKILYMLNSLTFNNKDITLSHNCF
jgi:hypothetical protein